MSKHINKCSVCGSFTMKSEHCGKKTMSPQPAKFSPEDKYGKYRRIAKKEKGLI